MFGNPMRFSHFGCFIVWEFNMCLKCALKKIYPHSLPSNYSPTPAMSPSKLHC